MSNNFATMLLGMNVQWSDNAGFHEGVIVAVSHEADFQILVLTNGKLVNVSYSKLTVR